MIIVNFAGGSKKASAKLYQWDYGQTLQIEGLNLPGSFKMHFSNGDNAVVTVEGTAVEGVGTVAIPDECIQRPVNDFRGWIYLEDSNSGKTIVTIVFYLEQRTMPSDVPPVSSVTEIKGYADYVAENAQKVAQAQQAAQNANTAALAANTAAQNISTFVANYYNKAQVESLISSAIADVSALIGGASS